MGIMLQIYGQGTRRGIEAPRDDSSRKLLLPQELKGRGVRRGGESGMTGTQGEWALGPCSREGKERDPQHQFLLPPSDLLVPPTVGSHQWPGGEVPKKQHLRAQRRWSTGRTDQGEGGWRQREKKQHGECLFGD